jgi:hypothetical protein
MTSITFFRKDLNSQRKDPAAGLWFGVFARRRLAGTALRKIHALKVLLVGLQLPAFLKSGKRPSPGPKVWGRENSK